MVPDGPGGEDPSPHRRWRSRRFEVVDRSMEPAFLPGDRLWVDVGWFRAHDPRVGDLVVLRDPGSPSRLLLKRVSTLEVGAGGEITGVRVLGDRRAESRDSRTFGPVARSELIGLVWFRYAPPLRRGAT